MIFADLLDRESLSKAMKDVGVLYQAAAVFKHWAKDPQKEIIDVNLEGTKNVLEVALDHTGERLNYLMNPTGNHRDVLRHMPERLGFLRNRYGL